MSRRPPLILLPPSEGKAPGGSGPAWTPGSGTAPELDVRRQRIMAVLVRAMAGSEKRRAALLGVKGEALAAATAANTEVASAPTLAAIDRYTGVLYGTLDRASLPAAQRSRIDRQVRIVSGLWGVVAAPDPIPDYKLKMGATLPRLGRLATWWRPAVTAALAPDVAGRTVWDLLPNEHRAAWAPVLAGADAPRSVVSARFLDEVVRDGRTQLVTVSHWNKLLKGALVRHVVAAQLDEVDGLSAFRHPLDYVYDPALTEHDPDGIRVRAAFVRRA